jgi:hypothetical protein
MIIRLTVGENRLIVKNVESLNRHDGDTSLDSTIQRFNDSTVQRFNAP